MTKMLLLPHDPAGVLKDFNEVGTLDMACVCMGAPYRSADHRPRLTCTLHGFA